MFVCMSRMRAFDWMGLGNTRFREEFPLLVVVPGAIRAAVSVGCGGVFKILH